jgi:hypothetical protein
LDWVNAGDMFGEFTSSKDSLSVPPRVEKYFIEEL